MQQEYQTEYSALPSFDLITVVRDVVRRWRLILAAAILAGIGVYALSEVTYTPRYTAYATYVVSPGGGTDAAYRNLAEGKNLASVFAGILNSTLLQEAVLEELDMACFDAAIQAAAVPETNLVTLEVTASEPHAAFQVTQAVLEDHSVISRQVLGDTVLEVLQEPEVPRQPSNPSRAGAAAKQAALLAVCGMCFLLAAVSYRRDAVRSRREGESKLDAVCLGELCHESSYKTLRAFLCRRKESVLVTKPAASRHFVESVRKLRCRVEQRLEHSRQVLLVTSVLENEGKTTVAVNLALSLAQKHKEVLLIDCDLQKPSCYSMLGKGAGAFGTADVISGHCGLDEALDRDEASGLHLLLEYKGCRSAVGLLGSAGMQELLNLCRARFDYVIIDLPPVWAEPDTQSLLEFTDGVLLVVRQNAAAARIRSTLAALEGDRARVLGYILNDVYVSPVLPGGGGGNRYCDDFHCGGYGRNGKYGKDGKCGGCRSAAFSNE